MKNLIAVTLLLVALCEQSSHAQIYSQYFTLTDSFGTTPYRVQDAFLRTEPFGTPVRYWQPSTPNVWGEVVYRFDIGSPAQSASMFMSAIAYTVGHPDANFDNNAQAYVDVSTDDLNYVNVLASYPGHAIPAVGPGDISALVAGADVIYVRSRLFMTTDFGSFSPSQFLRGDPGTTFNLIAVVPEPSAWALLGLGALGFKVVRRFKRKP